MNPRKQTHESKSIILSLFTIIALMSSIPVTELYATGTGNTLIWTPAEISSELWLDADDDSTITVSNGAVSKWNDKSGMDHDMVQDDASFKPTLKMTGLNGLKVVNFDGYTQQMETELGATWLNNTEFTVFAVTDSYSYFSYNRFMMSTDNPGNGDFQIGRGTSLTTWAFESSVESSWEYTSSPTLEALLSVTQVKNPGSQLWMNGEDFGQNTDPVASITDITQPLRLGGYDLDWWTYDGDIAEIVIVTGTISTETRQKMEGYLAWKWGLVANLPADHPYKLALPVAEPVDVDTDNDGVSDAFEIEKFGSITVVDTIQPFIETGFVEDVTHEWKSVSFDSVNAASNTILVCTPIYNNSHAPCAPVTRNVTATGFEVRMVSATTNASVAPTQISYMAMQKGYYRTNRSGIQYMAYEMDSEYASTYENMFTQNFKVYYPRPVVFGQVSISSNTEPAFQSFYSHGVKVENRTTHLQAKYGRSVGEDSNTLRPSEKIHIIVLLAGTYLLNDSYLEVYHSDLAVKGMDSGASSLNLRTASLENIALSVAGIRDTNLGFPVIYGDQFNSPLVDSQFDLAIDEDTFLDSERSHTAERVSVAVFSKEPPTAQLIADSWHHTTLDLLVLPKTGGSVTLKSTHDTVIHYTIDGSAPTSGSPVYASPIALTENTTIRAITKQTWGALLESQIRDFIIFVAPTEVAASTGQGYTYTVLHSTSGGISTFQESLPDTSGYGIKLHEARIDALNFKIDDPYTSIEVNSYLAVTKADTYTFNLSTKGSVVSNFYINDMQLPVIVNASTIDSSAEYAIYLEKGIYKIKIDGFNNTANARLTLNWKNSIFDEIVPSKNLFHGETELQATQALADYDGDGLSDNDEQNIHNTDHLNADSDLDGLTDYEEIVIHSTNALDSDSDNDNLSDYEEIVNHGTSALTFDSDGDGINDYIESLSNGAYTESFSINGIDYTTTVGQWVAQENGVKSQEFGGELLYHFNTTTDDMYFLNILGGGARASDIGKLFNCSVYVDDQYINTLNITDDVSHNEDNYGMKFDGSINVDEAGLYSFKLNSDGGSQLLINGQLVVDNDGLHGIQEMSGNIVLAVGVHTISVRYFEQAATDSLNVSLSGPSFAYRELNLVDLHGKLNWSYYEGSWSAIPNFDALQKIRSGFSDTCDLSVRKNQTRKTWYLPYLKAGNHSVKIVWNNALHERQLLIKALSFSSLAGEDLNVNGVKDWIEAKWNQVCTVSDVTTSLTSPVCLEGSGQFTNFMSISSGETVNSAINGNWYTNIHLSSNTITNFNVSFQNNVYAVNKSITWTATHIPSAVEIKIRLGDALLLNPNPVGSYNAGTISISGVTVNVSANTSLPYTFNIAGENEVTAEYTDRFGVTQIKTLTVNVVDINLPTATVPVLTGVAREVGLMNYLPAGAVYDADAGISSWIESNANNVSITESLVIGHKVLVRLYEKGPILGALKIQGVMVAGAGQANFYVSDVLEDGTKVTDLWLVANPITEEMLLRVDIFLPGVTFSDGSISKTLTKSDFDQLHKNVLTFLKGPGISHTAACHHIYWYDNGIYVKRIY